MISVGPFSIDTVIILIAVLLAWVTARGVARSLPDSVYKQAGAVLLDAVFWGFIAARLGYIAQWWEDYFAAPMSIIAIGDGGFLWWAGVPAALAFIWWRTRSLQMLRRSILIGVLTGLAAWFTTGVLIDRLQSPPMPDVQLTTLAEQPISLSSYVGRPTVVNLWATWCPPCRREMPVFEQAQAQFPDLAIVMVNQGESVQQIHAFLESENLTLTDVLRDPFSHTMQAMGARALPTTLFFDAQGRLVDSHMGELTMASFRNTVLHHFGQSAQRSTSIQSAQTNTQKE